MGRFDFKTRTGQISAIIQSTDGDAQAFFDRVTAAGGSLTLTEQSAITQLVSNMKTFGIWDGMKAIYPMVGASAAACAQNLKSSSFAGSFSSGWTFASTGVTPNGTSAFMDTGLNQSTNLSVNSVHLMYYSRTNNSKNSFDISGNTGSPSFNGAQLAAFYTGIGTIGHLHSYPTDSTISMTPTDTRAFYLASRISSTSNKLYRNATLLNTNTTARTSILANVNFKLATDNVSFTSRECALASIGDGLTDTQASDFYTVVQAFQTILSRNI